MGGEGGMGELVGWEPRGGVGDLVGLCFEEKRLTLEFEGAVVYGWLYSF